MLLLHRNIGCGTISSCIVHKLYSHGRSRSPFIFFWEVWPQVSPIRINATSHIIRYLSVLEHTHSHKQKSSCLRQMLHVVWKKKKEDMFMNLLVMYMDNALLTAYKYAIKDEGWKMIDGRLYFRRL